MPILLQYLFAIGVFQGALLSTLLVFDNRSTDASRILGVWCLLLAIWFLASFITLKGEINYFSDLIGWSYFLPASYGALLYLYCRNAILGESLTFSDIWHFMPITVCYLLNLDILFSSPEVKLGFILGDPPNSMRFIASESLMLFQAFVYIGFSIFLILKYQKKALNTLSNFNPRIFGWLWKLVLLNFFIWSFKTIMSIFTGLSILSHIADFLIVFLIYSIAMAQWRDPKLFRIEQLRSSTQDPIEPNQNNSLTLNKGTIAPFKIRENCVLDSSIRAKLIEAVRENMQEQQTFRDDQLTLTKLAKDVGVSPHHLSEALNQHEGKNFYRFVNEYRINYICARLKQDSSVKILDLAISAGFSSKSTFNAVFKQQINLTPTQYRNQLTSK